MTIRVMVASHVRLHREGVERALREATGMTLVGAASSAAETIDLASTIPVDVILLDVAMSEAFSAARQIARLCPRTKIVAVGMPEEEAEVLTCAQIGIAGYVTRDGSVSDVLAAVEAAARGEVHCSPKIAGSLFRQIAQLASERSDNTCAGELTVRERQIVKLLQQGMSNKMISRALGIELPTVKNHVHSILSKLGLHRRAEAISLLYQRDALAGRTARKQ